MFVVKIFIVKNKSIFILFYKYSMISVVTITNKDNPSIISNILHNYERQEYKKKELIIIINNNNILLDEYENKLKETTIKNYHLYKINQNISLGECLNYSIAKMGGEYWAKFDDDDHYSKYYLMEAKYYHDIFKPSLIGKKSVFLFDKNNDRMYLTNQSSKKYVNLVRGPTFFCHKKYFKKLNLRIRMLGRILNF